MSDNNGNQNGTNRSALAVRKLNEVLYFANNHALTIGEANVLIQEVGDNREALDKAARDYTGLTDR